MEIAILWCFRRCSRIVHRWLFQATPTTGYSLVAQTI